MSLSIYIYIYLYIIFVLVSDMISLWIQIHFLETWSRTWNILESNLQLTITYLQLRDDFKSKFRFRVIRIYLIRKISVSMWNNIKNHTFKFSVLKFNARALHVIFWSLLIKLMWFKQDVFSIHLFSKATNKVPILKCFQC